MILQNGSSQDFGKAEPVVQRNSADVGIFHDIGYQLIEREKLSAEIRRRSWRRIDKVSAIGIILEHSHALIGFRLFSKTSPKEIAEVFTHVIVGQESTSTRRIRWNARRWYNR